MHHMPSCTYDSHFARAPCLLLLLAPFPFFSTSHRHHLHLSPPFASRSRASLAPLFSPQKGKSECHTVKTKRKFFLSSNFFFEGHHTSVPSPSRVFFFFLLLFVTFRMSSVEQPLGPQRERTRVWKEFSFLQKTRSTSLSLSLSPQSSRRQGDRHAVFDPLVRITCLCTRLAGSDVEW